MSNNDNTDLELCMCVCHKKVKIKHITICCRKCPKCKKKIKSSCFEEHVQKCFVKKRFW